MPPRPPPLSHPPLLWLSVRRLPEECAGGVGRHPARRPDHRPGAAGTAACSAVLAWAELGCAADCWGRAMPGCRHAKASLAPVPHLPLALQPWTKLAPLAACLPCRATPSPWPGFYCFLRPGCAARRATLPTALRQQRRSSAERSRAELEPTGPPTGAAVCPPLLVHFAI